jgi:hypothetical protein
MKRILNSNGQHIHQGLGPSIDRFNPAMYVKREGLGPSINRFNPATFLCMFQARSWISIVICRGFFLCVPRVNFKGDYSFC